MGQLDNLKSYTPENILAEGVTGNPLEYYVQRPSRTYSTPEQFSMSPENGPFTVAGVYEVNGREFTQDRWHWPSANTQIVTIPQQPVDQGAADALIAMSRGVYLQGNVTGTTKQYSGSAPTSGIYTGYNSSELDGC